LVVVLLLLYFGAALPASAEPDAGPLPPVVADESLPPDSDSWPSAEPGFLAAPDRWNLTVRAETESIRPVAPLTTSLASREYIVGGTFTGVVRGAGRGKLIDVGRLDFATVETHVAPTEIVRQDEQQVGTRRYVRSGSV